MIAGFDIGGTKCAVVLAQNDIELLREGKAIISKASFSTSEYLSPESAMNKLGELLNGMLTEHKSHGVLEGIGISCGGPLDSKKGIILSPPNLPGWDEVHITEYFNDLYGVPVVLNNDANACAVAEWRFGAATDTDNAVFLTFGTGMGAGLILDGRLYCGASDMAGEVGHVRLADSGPFGYGKHGSFEGFCSGGGIARMAEDMLTHFDGETNLRGVKLTAKAVCEQMYRGDKFAESVMLRCGEYLGRALAMLADILNPEVIVIGSIYERNTEFFLPVITEVIRREALPETARILKIRPSRLGNSIGDYAALGLIVKQG